MSAFGYQQTLAEPRCEVRFPLESGRWRSDFQSFGVLCLLTARKQTLETNSPNVSF